MTGKQTYRRSNKGQQIYQQSSESIRRIVLQIHGNKAVLIRQKRSESMWALLLKVELHIISSDVIVQDLLLLRIKQADP
jgi:hypothetical protein